MEDLIDAQQKAAALHKDFRILVMVDHECQVRALEAAGDKVNMGWKVFIKVDGGGKRAGATPHSKQMADIVKALLSAKHVNVFGFYSRE